MNPALLKGKKVVGSEGHVLGEFEDLDIYSNAWEAKVFHVNLSDDAAAELGFKKSFMSKIQICLATSLVSVVGDIVTLKEPISDLAALAEREKLSVSAELKGKRVFGAKGYNVGVVEGFDVELSTWKVTGLEVGLTDDAAEILGFKRPFLSKVLVIVPTDIVSAVGNFITLDEDIENLESLVKCLRSCQKLD